MSRFQWPTGAAALAVCIASAVSTAAQGDDAQSGARYVAVFADDRRMQGNRLTGWGEDAASPQLDGVPLLDPGRPFRWMRDLTLPEPNATGIASPYVEFACGDRLVGQVVGVASSAPTNGEPASPWLLVSPAAAMGLPSRLGRDVIRIRADAVSRVVLGRRPSRSCPPSTAMLADGTQVPFSRMRWIDDGVSLLVDGGVRRVPFAELAELRLPSADPWGTYYRQLAVLRPEPSSVLIRLETAAGTVITISTNRLRVTVAGKATVPENWFHLVQPSWSADPVCVRFTAIRTWWCFAPHEVPLMQLEPSGVVQQSLTGYAWPWRRNRNVQGGELIAGGEPAGWGLGVQAHNELTFDLPPFAAAFRARVGLDRAAGHGGCARALVYLDSPKARPLFRSKLLIGSAEAVDTGELDLRAPREGPARLILAADAAHDDRPPGADPLDIRDALDWIDPIVRLDPAGLWAEVTRHAAAAVPAWGGWTVHVAGASAVPVQSRWDESDRKEPRFVSVVTTGGRELTLTARRHVSGPDWWLKVWVRQVGPTARPGRLQVRADGQAIADAPVQRAGLERPYLIRLAAYQGREIELQAVYTPGEAAEEIEWPTLALVSRPTRVDWAPLLVVGASSQNGAELRILGDGSILAGPSGRRVDRGVDTYVVDAATDLPGISAIRLEALADPALPGGGPGRDGGNFVLSQLRLSTLPTRRETLRGRYVRVGLPRPDGVLSLAEVQVFSPPPGEAELLDRLLEQEPAGRPVAAGRTPSDLIAILKTPAAKRDLAQRRALQSYLDAVAENVARHGAAAQSSTMGEFTADIAIDGEVGGRFTHTHAEDRPWWRLDLGRERPIDRIVVWNRIDFGLVDRLRDFDVAVLDEGGKVVWQRQGIADPPVPAVELAASDTQELPIRAAGASFAQGGHGADRSLDSAQAGWSVAPRTGESHAAVFLLERPVDARATGLRIELKHAREQSPQSLGRFRLLATGASPPIDCEPVGIVIEPLPPGSPAQAGAAAGPSPEPPPSPWALFEDEGAFLAAGPAGQPGTSLVSDDRHAGQRAARIAPGGPYRLRLARIVPIRAQPAQGEFRYVRFAFRKYGGGQVRLSLEHISSVERPCRYEAGARTPTDPGGRSVWPLELPEEWIVVDRDVFQDFGRLDLTGLAIACADGGHALLDHVYVARRREDFDELTFAPSRQSTNDKARRILAGPIIDRALPAVVRLERAGRPGTGVLVGQDGCILTAGHFLAGPDRNVTVRTRDGRTLPATVAGIDRDIDIGLVRIAQAGPWQGLALAGRETFDANGLYAGLSFVASSPEDGTPVGFLAFIVDVGRRTVWTDYRLDGAAVGGPLLNAKGRIVGVHTQVNGVGNLVFSQARAAAEGWARLRGGEVWGEWMSGCGPMMGIFSTQTREGCRIDHVYPDMPAAAAGIRAGDILVQVEGQPVSNLYDSARVLADKDPGVEVTVLIRRDGQTFHRKVRLMPRMRLPDPATTRPAED